MFETHRVYRGQAFCPVVRIGPPNPSPASECWRPPGPRGETHSLGGEGGGRTQFIRRDRHSATLPMYTIIPLRLRLIVFTANRISLYEWRPIFICWSCDYVATTPSTHPPSPLPQLKNSSNPLSPPPQLKKLVCKTYFFSLFVLLLYVRRLVALPY